MKILFILIIFFGLTRCDYGPLFWPLPNNFSAGNLSYTVDPCNIQYKISTIPVYLAQTKDFYLIEAFRCKSKQRPKSKSNLPTLNVTLTVIVTNTTLIPPFEGFQSYTLNLQLNGSWQLRADYYPGFLRGFETFSQIFKVDQNQEHYVQGLPITVSDSPQFSWRGIMIDSSRHFLKVDTIKKTIDACLFNKINVVHWHITDQDSFPLEIQSHPQLTKYGSFGKTYSKSDVLDIVNYALRKGVRIVPQIDSPAHTQAWGRSPQLNGITLNCNGMYQGQFDPTLNKTYQVLTDVMKEVNQMFIDPVMHFGGDQVVLSCWDKKPSIKQWMDNNNISDYNQLQIYYRQRQKSIWKLISNKAVSYWANQQIDLPTENNDYIHWWGVQKNVRQLENRTNKIILSNYDLTYLDVGYGGRAGTGYGDLQTWRQMYAFQPNIPNIKGKIMGGEACLWSEVNNDYTQFQKLMLRASVITERLWNSNVQPGIFRQIVTRLAEHGRRLGRRQIPFAPVTVQLCEIQASNCFF